MQTFEANKTMQVRLGYDVIKVKCDVKSFSRDDGHLYVEAIVTVIPIVLIISVPDRMGIQTVRV